MIQGAGCCPFANHAAFYRLLVGGLGPAPPVGHPWVDPPGASTHKAHAACSSGRVPDLMRMIHGASGCPIANHGAFYRLLVGGLGPAPPVGHPWVDPGARRFHTQGTCGLLIGPRPGPNASDPRRKRLSDRQPRGLLPLAGGWTWARTARGSPVGRPARRFHTQGTCGLLIGPRPGPNANDPRRKGPSDTKGRGRTAPAGGWTWARTTPGGVGPSRPARRFDTQGTCGLLIGPRPGPNANDPRRKRLSDRQPRGLLPLAH